MKKKKRRRRRRKQQDLSGSTFLRGGERCLGFGGRAGIHEVHVKEERLLRSESWSEDDRATVDARRPGAIAGGAVLDQR
ncbi:unnamed protein product [Pleuronectes platessa]|uniref:Uncharacterized protein n=1 Tax=Pleuronectes platessa TaxID=8262 RepID=A0A9N7ZC63_PLEPL|nr:unnamed protein product [Pleuronectes platessa]